MLSILKTGRLEAGLTTKENVSNSRPPHVKEQINSFSTEAQIIQTSQAPLGKGATLKTSSKMVLA